MIKHETGKLSFTLLFIFNCGFIINGQIIGVEESSHMDQRVSSLMRGGNSLKKENFPWFAFIRTGFPQFKWKYWDEKDERIKFKPFTWGTPYVFLCSGVWVTAKHVITSDHCFWLARPKYHSFGDGDPKKNTNVVELFKNMIEDKSFYTDPNTKKTVKRGKLENIAVKLYGNDYASAHPTDATTENIGIAQPWFQISGKSFKVEKYNYIEGGANAAKTGSFNTKSVDLAVLTLYESCVTKYFNNLPLSLTTDVFSRLEWVENKKDKLTDKMETIVIGAGHRSKTEPNPEQKAFVSKEYRRKSKVNCEKYVPWYNPGWTVCMVNRVGGPDSDKLLYGDSGGPVLTEIKEKTATPDDKKQYRLHAITGAKYLHKPAEGHAEYWSVTVYVGRKKDKILGP